MQQIPDITPALKGGIVGILVFVIFSLCLVIAWLLKNKLEIAGPKGPPREPLTGEKPTEYWEAVLKDTETEGNRALLQVLTEQHRSTMEILGRLRARMRESDQAATSQALKEFRQKYDQDIIAIAKMLRAIEEKIEH